MTSYRVPREARPLAAIDDTRPISFRFDGRSYRGFEGDTLASALLANSVSIVGRSFKYHRPRGVVGFGLNETNALMQLGVGGRSTPNVLATTVRLHEGLEARSVNSWPSARFDLASVFDKAGKLLVAGFYYKTFMWPSWRAFEGPIRRAAGLGRSPELPDPDLYEAQNLHCDVLVVGAGPAGLMAAQAAASSGARVVLAESDDRTGGQLAFSAELVAGAPAGDWVAAVEAELRAMPNVTVLTSTTVNGYYDHNWLSAVERVETASLRQRLWKIRARQVVLATGAAERPLVFADNDRPGVMLAGAMLHHLTRYGVAVGARPVFFTTDDEAYRAAIAAVDAGVEVQAVIDARLSPAPLAEQARSLGVEVLTGCQVTRVRGARGVRAVEVVDPKGRRRTIACDAVGMSGGWTPNIQLHSQAGGKVRYDAAVGAFRPAESLQRVRSCGAGAGVLDLRDCLEGGRAAGMEAAGACGRSGPPAIAPAVAAERTCAPTARRKPAAGGKAFVDFQTDVTRADLGVAVQENYRSVEHVKRYTVLGMGADQGKLSGAVAMGVLGELMGVAPEAVGVTTFRPPYAPVPLGLVSAAIPKGELFRPRRRLPGHDWHQALGAVFEDFGWQRPAYYPRAGETMDEAVRREALAVRHGVGLFEASPLGKIEVRGPDAGAFLDRIYVGMVSTLKVGRARYGLMLNELGVMIDDGVVSRLADDHFLVSTSSANAERIFRWLEEWRQCEWPLELVIQNVTTQWGVLTLAGPDAREVLAASGVKIDLDRTAFPHMQLRQGEIDGVPLRILRASFTGELSYEISVPAACIESLAHRLCAAGRRFRLTPFGLEAQEVLRLEKGYIHIGLDTDSSSQPDDIGCRAMYAGKPGDFIGKRSLLRPASSAAGRLQLVGFQTVDPQLVAPVGSHVVRRTYPRSEGFVTSSYASPTLGRSLAIGLLRDGRQRLGQTVTLWSEGRETPAVVTAPQAYDPAGDRLDG